MIKFKNYTPAVYYAESRDFQLLGRLFDVVLNSVKTEADQIYNIPISEDSDDALLNLMAFTLGLRLRTTRYTAEHLRALCEVFPMALRKKGTIESIEIVCDALQAAEGIAVPTVVFKDPDPRYPLRMVVAVSQQYSHIVLLEEVLAYIIPGGMSFVIRQADFVRLSDDSALVTKPELVDTVRVGITSDNYRIAQIDSLDDADEVFDSADFTQNIKKSVNLRVYRKDAAEDGI